MNLQPVVVVSAVAFAAICGVNDGGAMLAAGLRVRGLPPWVAVTIAAGSVALVPAVFGTAVARTLTQRLVTLDGPSAQSVLLVAVVVAVATTAALSSRGLPTSLTLALVGALTGAGLGAGSPVSGSTVVFVLSMAIVAPLVGCLASWLLTAGAAAGPSRFPMGRWLRPTHLMGFGLQCLAYGANDGQKMLAVMAVALGVSSPGNLRGAQLATLAVTFGVGTAAGLPWVAGTLGSGVVPIQPVDAVVTEVSSAGVVLASSVIGAPVSMTQAVSGAMVGTRMTRGRGRIRWAEVGRLVVAWLVTLPIALVLAALLTMLVA